MLCMAYYCHIYTGVRPVIQSDTVILSGNLLLPQPFQLQSDPWAFIVFDTDILVWLSFSTGLLTWDESGFNSV